jgi:ribosomal protein S27AE
MGTEKLWKCGKCGVPLVVKKTSFSYLGRTFTHEVQRCPECGNVFIPRELAEGRMAEVEQQMEDK